SADRGHIHHRLLDRGLTPRRAVLVLYLVCAIGSGFALVMTLPHAPRYTGFAILGICAVVVLGIRQLRYREFGLASRVLFGGQLQKALAGQLLIERLASDLEQAESEDGCWELLIGAAKDFGFDSVSLSLHGRVRNAVVKNVDAAEGWFIRVPLGSEGFV